MKPGDEESAKSAVKVSFDENISCSTVVGPVVVAAGGAAVGAGVGIAVVGGLGIEVEVETDVVVTGSVVGSGVVITVVGPVDVTTNDVDVGSAVIVAGKSVVVNCAVAVLAWREAVRNKRSTHLNPTLILATFDSIM